MDSDPVRRQGPERDNAEAKGGAVATRVGINGFGRIGRNFFRAYLERSPGYEIVAVNDLAPADVLAHMLRFDSTHGVLDAEVEAGEAELRVGGESIRVLSE